jgi:3-oxoacyl-[acyl-carrier-protein] synthase-3
MKLTNNLLCLPTSVIDVAELLKLQTGKTDVEIQKTIEITGIRSFRRSKSKQLSTFVLNAARQAQSHAPGVFDGADALIVVSQSYDLRIPSVSTQLQAVLSLDAETFCVDINDGCAGFIKAVRLVELLIRDGKRKVIVVAGDLNSVMTEQADPSTAILFGDGIAITTFEQSEEPAYFALFNDGKSADKIRCVTSIGAMEMNGFEVFRFTRNAVPRLVSDYFSKASVTAADFDLFGFHQASKLIVSSLTSLLKLRNEGRADFNCEEVGNLGSGSIGAWLALTTHLEDGLARRMLVLGYGAGLSWGLADLVVQIKTNGVIYVED